MRPRIVVDARMASASGIGTYVRNVLPRVAQLEPAWDFTVLVAWDADSAWAQGSNVRVVSMASPVFSLSEQVELSRWHGGRASLFWATNYNVPLLSGAPLVVTVHDLAHVQLPEYTGSFLRHAYSRFMFGAVRRRAAGLLFVSEFTRGEFQRAVGASRASAAVVQHGVDPVWRERLNDTPPIAGLYFVCVGNLKPHKNLRTLLAAFATAGATLDARLVVIGRHEGLRTVDAESRKLAASGVDGRIVLTGHLDDAAIRRYVRHATALVMPSRYEGFGLPPLEAMAAGTATIVARAASLPEVCGDAALYFDPDDVAGLARALATVARDGSLRADLVKRGRAHVAGFTWEAAASRTRALLADVLARTSRDRASA